MAEPAGLPKPGDLLIGVVDFFAILIPGVVAAMYIAWAKQLIPKDPEALSYGTVLLAGFILGHVLHGAGSFLDVLIYDPLFRPWSDVAGKKPHGLKAQQYFRANDAIFHEALWVTGFPKGINSSSKQSNLSEASKTRDAPPGGMYQWARAWLRMHSPEATAELDRLEADSKLFRSLTVLVVAVMIGWSAAPHIGGELPLIIAIGVFSLWRYCDLRQKMVRSCYLHYIQVQSAPTGRA